MKTSPLRMSSITDRPACTGWGAARIASTATPATANDAASVANAIPGLNAAMIQPPIAGPARRWAIGRTNWSSELAAGRSAPGRMSGTSASKAGVKNAVPAPYTIARPAISHT